MLTDAKRKGVMRTTVALFAFCNCLAAQSHRLTLEDLVSPEPVGESVLSPDGKTFAMTRSGQIVLRRIDGRGDMPKSKAQLKAA